MLSTWTWEPHARRIYGKAISQETTSFIGLRCGICFGPGKKPRSCGPFGIKQWQLMYEGLALHQRLSPNDVPFASQTWVNRSNTNPGIAFKLGGHGDGPHLSCMNYVGLELATMIVLSKSKLCLGKGLLRNLAKISKFGHLLHGITFWTIWFECNNKVFNHEHWHESKVKHRIWDVLINYAQVAWERVIKQIKINSFSTVAMLQGFDQMWGARNALCRRNDLHVV